MSQTEKTPTASKADPATPKADEKAPVKGVEQGAPKEAPAKGSTAAKEAPAKETAAKESPAKDSSPAGKEKSAAAAPDKEAPVKAASAEAPVVEEASEPLSHHPATKGMTMAEINTVIVDASTPIDTAIPYNPVFSERAPVLEVFTRAVLNAHVQNLMAQNKSKNSTSKKDDTIHVIEFGVYRGRGSRALMEVAERLGFKIHLTGLDTFEGLPELSETDLSVAPPKVKYLTRKVFADTTVREVNAYIGDGFSSTWEFKKGLFSDTLPDLEKDRRYAFALIDCDLYEGHLEALDHVYDRMISGGIIMFDDYFSKEYPMAKLAVDKFLEDKPESIFQIRHGSYRQSRAKAFIVR